MGKITDPFKATRYTERTVNQILVEWINKFIEELNLPLGKAKQEMILADQKQPDILIFDKDNKRVICFDNHEGKKPHKHIKNKIFERYIFCSIGDTVFSFSLDRFLKG